MLYEICNGSVSVGGELILSHLDFRIKDKEKIAIIGRNGAGKTTLLRLIYGDLDLDRDDQRQGPGIRSDRHLSIEMLNQTPQLPPDFTIEELIDQGRPDLLLYSKEAYAYDTEYDRIFTGFGFHKEDKIRPISSFSGGEQTKIQLIALLLKKPDLLLLDEPTNHLDLPAIEWLETYMKSYDKAVIFVSHDRYFLDQVVDIVYELYNKKLYRYSGNYTRFRQEKRKKLYLWNKDYEQQQEELKRLNDLIEKFKGKPRKAAFARSRKKMIERMELIEKPPLEELRTFNLDLTPRQLPAKWVLEAEELKVGYENPLLELSLRIRRGQKIAIIGDNGTGKTTLLKTIAGVIPKIKGKCTLGNRVEAGYFDQQSSCITSDKTVLEHFHDLFPALTEKELRHVLGTFLFSGKDALKKFSILSGGEKSRLLLAELLYFRYNFLILDEPTNHMDLPAKELLEDAFIKYTGTLLFVSHDRYFLSQIADAILFIEDGKVYYYPFGYEHYCKHAKNPSSGEMTALVKAQDQALITSLQNVPKAERHRLKEYDTEELFDDWRMRLAREELTASKVQAAEAAEQLELRELDCLEKAASEEDFCSAQAKKEAARERLNFFMERFTKNCLAYYDVYNEIDPY